MICISLIDLLGVILLFPSFSGAKIEAFVHQLTETGLNLIIDINFGV